MAEIKKSTAVIVIISTVTVLSLILGLVAFFILKPNISVSAVNKENKNAETKSYDIENELLTKPIEITTNLKLEDENYRKHYISTTIVLSTTDEEVFTKLEASEIFLQDIYNKYLNGITYSKITNLENSEIREDIKKIIKDKLEIEIGNIYFTKFIIQ